MAGTYHASPLVRHRRLEISPDSPTFDLRPSTPGQKKCPTPFDRSRAYTWRRPTLTEPIVQLPSALQCFTSGFGMGPGGSTALWPPEGNPVCLHPRTGSLTVLATALLLLFLSRSLGRFGPRSRFFSSRPLPDIRVEISCRLPFPGSSSFLRSRLSCLPLDLSPEDLNLLWNQAERMISTGELHTLPHLHPQPINVVVSDDPSGRTHLGKSLALRCFQRLSRPHLATQPCP